MTPPVDRSLEPLLPKNDVLDNVCGKAHDLFTDTARLASAYPP